MLRIAPLLMLLVCWSSCSSMPEGEDAGPGDSGVDAGRVEVDAGHEEIDAGLPDDDAGVPDAGTVEDAGVRDAGFTIDAGFPDAGPTDAGAFMPLAGFGLLSGECGPMSHMDLVDANPTTYATALDFQMMPFDAGALSDGGYRMYGTANLGGSSVASEVFAYEVLHRCELAELVATEAEVTYDTSTSKKTDLVIDVEGERIGVSVVRAFKFPPGSALTVAEAKTKLEGKFSDIHSSTAHVSPPYVWRKQILAVLAYDQVAFDAVIQAALQIDSSIRGDTILYITRTDGDDAFIY